MSDDELNPNWFRGEPSPIPQSDTDAALVEVELPTNVSSGGLKAAGAEAFTPGTYFAELQALKAAQAAGLIDQDSLSCQVA